MWAVVIGEFAAQGNFLKVTENLFRQQQTHKHRSLQRFKKKKVNCAFHTFFFFFSNKVVCAAMLEMIPPQF